MKPVILVLVCVVFVGCHPRSTTSKQEPPINSAEPCLPAKTACIVRVDGVSLIRAPTFWLLDLRGRSGFDVAAVIDAARACDGPKGCGVAMANPAIEALVSDLAQAKVEKLSIFGGPVAVYRLAPGPVVQGWRDLEKIVAQLPPVPSLSRSLCDTGQCELPPPIPPRYLDFRRIAIPMIPIPR